MAKVADGLRRDQIVDFGAKKLPFFAKGGVNEKTLWSGSASEDTLWGRVQ